MDNKIVFVKTSKGENELHGSGALLSGDIRRALAMVDGVATFADILKHAAPSLRAQLPALMAELQTQGYVQDKAKMPLMPKLVVPKRVVAGGFKSSGGGELDFTSVFQPPTPEILAAEAAKAAKAAEAAQSPSNNTPHAVDAMLLAKQQAALLERQVQQEAERRASELAEKIRKQAELEASERVKTELEAAKARIVAEAQARVAAEEKARLAAELRVHQAAELERLQARQAQLDVEQAAEKAALEAARQAKEVLERQANEERLARELAERQAKVLLERQAKELAEHQARELEARRAKELAEQQAKEERQARELVEQQAKELAERQAKALLEIQAKELAEQQARGVEVRRAQALAEQQVREERLARELAEQQTKELVKVTDGTLTKNQSMSEASKATAVAKPATDDTESRLRAERTDPNARTTTATVLFFDMVAYSKQSVNRQTTLKKLFNQLVSSCLASLDEQESEFIILDTGDGAAIGFMQHPEDALEVAMQFRRMVGAEPEFAELRVRMGIHLGPINVMVDMNGKPNMVGSGINDAQRVMDFAGAGEIFISRSYFDFVSRLSEEYEELFRYRGVRKDKHGLEHPVYELLDPFEATTVRVITPVENTSKIQLEPVVMANLPVETGLPRLPEPEIVEDGIPQLMLDEPTPTASAEEITPVVPPTISESERLLAEDMAKKTALLEEITEKRRVAAEEAEAKKLAESQTKAWKHAERRAQESAKANAERAVQQEVAANVSTKVLKAQQPVKQIVAPPPSPPASDRRWLLGAGGGIALLFLALFFVPMFLSMNEYERELETALSSKFQQPVHIAKVALRLLPTPQLTLHELIIGKESLTRVQQVTADLALLRLFEQHKTITHLKIEGVRTSSAQLDNVAHWLDTFAADEHYTIRKVELLSSTLEADSFGLNGIRGELRFDPSGHFVDGELVAANGNATMNLAKRNGIGIFDATVRTGVFPFIPRWAFDEAHLKGRFTDEGALVEQMSGRILAGFFSGKMQLAWRNGWLVDGDIELGQVDMQKVTYLLTGGLKLNAHFKLQSPQFATLQHSFGLTGRFVVNDGQFKGTDMARVLRSRGTDRSPGGRTSFNELTGSVACLGSSCQFKQLNLHHGTLNATGETSIDSKQKISGVLRAGMSPQEVQTGMVFLLSGTQDQFEIAVQ